MSSVLTITIRYPELKRRQHLGLCDVCLLYNSAICVTNVDDTWWLCVVVDTSITNDIIPTATIGFRARRRWVHEIHFKNSVNVFEIDVAIQHLVLMVPNKQAS